MLASATSPVEPIERSSRPSGGPAFADWGLLDYERAWQRQLGIWSERARGAGSDLVVAVEHPPTVTLGRHAPDLDLQESHEELLRRGIVSVRSDRGGRATFHGPGQAVIYPIVGIADRGLGVAAWVALLEDALVATLGAFGVEGRLRDGRPGVWTGAGAKIASLGLRVARGVSYHGISINVDGDLSGFDLIATCGVRGERVTSITAETDCRVERVEVSRRSYDEICKRLAGGLRAKEQP